MWTPMPLFECLFMVQSPDSRKPIDLSPTALEETGSEVTLTIQHPFKKRVVL